MTTVVVSRVLLVGRQLIRDMVEQLVVSHPEIHVVGSCDFSTGLVAQVDRTHATVVLLADGENQIGPACDELLRARPHLKAFGVVDDGRESFVCELRPARTLCGPLSPEVLIDKLRPGGGSWMEPG